MTLQRFLVAVGESRVAWLGQSGWRPAASERFGFGLWLVQGAAGAVYGLVPGLLMAGLVQLHPQLRGGWWPLVWCAFVGAFVGWVGYGLIAVAWNRRAAELSREGRTEPLKPAATRWWQRWLVAPFYGLVCFLVTPLLLAVSVDNALGRLAWKRELASRAARGEPMGLETLRGPAPAEAENFAMAPLVRAMWDFETGVTNGRGEIVWKDPVNHARAKCLAVPQNFRPRSESRRDRLRDTRVNLDWIARSIRTLPLVRPEGLPEDVARRVGVVDQAPKQLPDEEVLAIPIADPAGEVLAYLKRLEPELKEIEEAARRSRSRFTLRWDADVVAHMPYLASLKTLSLTYRIRAVARLQKGDTAGAFEDVRVGFRLAEALSEDPVVISYLVEIAQYSIATSAAWHGLVDHRWNEAQLRELQDRFARADSREALKRSIRGEKWVGLGYFDRWLGAEAEPAIGSPAQPGFEEAGMGGAGSLPPLPFFAPRGVFRRNQVNHARAFDRFLEQLEDPAWPRNVAELDADEHADNRYLARLGLVPRTPNNILPAMLMPALRKTQSKAARMAVVARLAETACALERYRLRQGTYPDGLDRLTPTYLESVPTDPMNGKPLGYRRTNEGWFDLWSVGLNGRDDGGVMLPERNDEDGDWIWPQPVPTTGLRLF